MSRRHGCFVLLILFLLLTSPARAEEPARLDSHGDPLPQGALARIGTMRFCQPWVCVVAWSPDGKCLASAGHGNVIHLWDSASGKEVSRIEAAPCHLISSLVWSPNGKTLASATCDNAVQVWSIDTGKERCRLGKEKEDLGFLAFSPDGRWLACTAERTVRLWDTATWAEASSFLSDQAGRLQAVAFSGDGKVLTAGGTTGVHVWDFADRKGRFLPATAGCILSVSLSPDGKRLASTAGTRVVVLDTDTGKERYHASEEGTDGQDFWRLQFSPDGKTLAGSGRHHPLRLWSAEDGKELFRVDEGDTFSGALEFAPDGRTLAVGTDDAIRLWDPATGRERLPRGGLVSGVSAIAFAPDGRHLAVAGKATGGIFDRATLRETVHFSAERSVQGMAFSSDGASLSTFDGRQMAFWDVATSRNTRNRSTPPKETWQLDERVNGVISSDLRRLVTWNVPTIEMGNGRRRVPREPLVMEFVAVHEARTGKELARYPSPDFLVSDSALSSNGTTLALSGNDGVVRIYHLTGGRETDFRVKDGDGQMRVAFAPHGRSLAVSTSGGLLVLVECATGQERAVLLAHPGLSFALAFSPDGRTVATWANDGPIVLWDVVRGVELKRFTGHTGRILSVAFSPDGRTLATGGADTTVLLWDVGEGLQEPRRALTDEQRERYWAALAKPEACRGWEAMVALEGAAGTAGWLRRQQIGPKPLPAQRLAQMVTDLDSEEFEVREQATRELENHLDVASPDLKEALAGEPSLEVRCRLERLIASADKENWGPEMLRALRAIEVLEISGTPEARRVLAGMATGEPRGRLTQEAKASLERLARRGAPRP